MSWMNKPKAGDRVLWVKFTGFGDVLQTVSSIKSFKEMFPGIHVTLLTSKPYAELMLAQPCVDAVVTGRKTSLKEFYSLVCELKKQPKFDWIISLQDKSKTDTIGWMLGVPNRVGSGYRLLYNANLWNWLDEIGLDIRKRESSSIFASADSIKKNEPLLTSLPSKKVFAVIGAAWVEKMWPTDYWCELVKELVADGYGVVLNGHGEYEMEVASKIESSVNSSAVLNMVDKLSFNDMCAVSSLCTVAVGNDTGPLHLAALQGVPTIGVFGAIRPQSVGYLMPWFSPVYSTCYRVGCGLSKECPRKIKTCLNSVTPQRVKAVFDRMVCIVDKNK